MYNLYGFFSQNSMKPLYVAEELGCDFRFHFVDLMRRENHGEAFRAMTPVSKVPVLEHNGQALFESGAICRYLANAEGSELYPAEKMMRAQVDQWLDYFTCHAGRHLTTIYFQKIIKPAAGMGEPDAKSIEEAEVFAHQSMKVLERSLHASQWLANDRLSIADLAAFAYMEQEKTIDFPLASYPRVQDWYGRLQSLPSVSRARKHVAPFVEAIMGAG